MATVFDQAMAAIFRNTNLAEDVDWWPRGVAPGVTVRAVRAAPDVLLDFQGTALRSDSLMIEVQVADVACAAEGDSFVVRGLIHLVDGAPQRDREGLVWRIGLVPEESA